MAGQEVRMVEEELRAKEQEIIAKVKSAYADYFMASKNLEIYKELLELVRYTSTTAERLYEVGRVPQQDVIKALLERTELLNSDR
jgi:outer membrane protein TolC